MQIFVSYVYIHTLGPELDTSVLLPFSLRIPQSTLCEKASEALLLLNVRIHCCMYIFDCEYSSGQMYPFLLFELSLYGQLQVCTRFFYYTQDCSVSKTADIFT